MRLHFVSSYLSLTVLLLHCTHIPPRLKKIPPRRKKNPPSPQVEAFASTPPWLDAPDYVWNITSPNRYPNIDDTSKISNDDGSPSRRSSGTITVLIVNNYCTDVCADSASVRQKQQQHLQAIEIYAASERNARTLQNIRSIGVHRNSKLKFEIEFI